MSTQLCLLRHGRALGQGSNSQLLPDGEADVAALGRKLAHEGFKPVAAFSSTYDRARDTARIVLGELASDVPLVQLHELTPDNDPADALAALEARGLPAGPVLVVSHLPLVARLTHSLTEELVDFLPGTFAEIGFDPGKRRGWLMRTLQPGGVAGD